MDRIYEAYHGTGGFGADFMRKTRERLHWICSQVRGKDVLDVACSQGIVPILLGRMGFEVAGVDVNAEAIAFAKEQLEKENGGVRQKVFFAVEDFMAYEPPCVARFDTVIMGEVLEHLIVPDVFIARAHALLAEHGRLVVTVPFGINDAPDHRQTFYLSNAYLLMAPYFEIEEVRFFGGWLGMVCVRRPERLDKLPSTLPLSLIGQAEAAFNKLERPLVDVRTRVSVLTKQLADERKKTADLTLKIASLDSQEVKDLRASLDSKSMELVERAERCGRLAAECESGKSRVAALEAEQKKLQKAFEGEAALRKKFSSEAYNSGKTVEAQAARIKALEAALAEQRNLVEQHKRESAAVQKRLTSAESELAEKSKTLAEIEVKCASEEKLHREFSSEAFRLGKEKTALEQKMRALVLERDGLSVRLKKSDAAYEKLSRAKLGRLTLWYWRVKDGIKSGRRVRPVAIDSRPAKKPLPQNDAVTWKAQRENESRFFDKS